MKKYINLLPLLFIGCVSTDISDVPTPNSFRKPPPSAKIYAPKRDWVIRKESDLDPLVKLGAKVTKEGLVLRVDLKGITIDGKYQKGDGGQSENQTPLFRAKTPLMIENGFFDNPKNAATFYSPNSGVKNITIRNIGEDGVATADGAKNFLVQGCEFSGAEDKNLQLNEASGARIIGNTFAGGFTGVRVGKISYSAKSDKATCSKNKFISIDTAWNVAKVTLEVVEKNSYENVRLEFKTSPGGKIKNADGKVSND